MYLLQILLLLLLLQLLMCKVLRGVAVVSSAVLCSSSWALKIWLAATAAKHLARITVTAAVSAEVAPSPLTLPLLAAAAAVPVCTDVY